MDPDKDNLIRNLQELQDSIKEGDLENIKKITDCFHKNLALNKQLLSELYTSGIECPTQTDLILAACKYKKADILYFILKETDILIHLTDDSFDDTKVNEQRTDAIKEALSLEDLFELLYDFWCGNLHWSRHDMKNIEMVGIVFQNASDACPINNHNLQLPTDFYSLITFNDFQREIYTELAKLNRSDVEPKPEESSANVIRKVLSIYWKYSDIEKVRIKHTSEEKEAEIKAGVKHKSAFYRIHIHNMYEKYFRKLDFNVALLILENLYVIRKHLMRLFNKTEKYFEDNPNKYGLYKTAAEKYEGIESTIYHFIYRTSEDWRLYVTKMKRITVVQKAPEHLTDSHEGILKYKKLTLHADKVDNAAVIFFERENFKECLKDLDIILDKYVKLEDAALVGTQNNQDDKSKVKTLLNENYLRTVSYMRDHYSLKKIVDYIEAIENTTDNNVLMVERVVHVVGEMLKSSKGKENNESHHLSRSTQALLQIAISVETIGHLQHIRNFLSHPRESQLSIRIDMANTQAQRFEDIKKELIEIKKIINSVLNIYMPILDKSLLEKGLRLLEQRLQYLTESKTCSDKKLSLNELFDELCSQLIILQEIRLIEANKAQIESKIEKAAGHISTNVLSMPILDKSLLEEGLRLLEQRLQYLTESKTCFDENLSLNELFDELCSQLIILQEIRLIEANKAQIESKIEKATGHISTNVLSILPSFIQESKQILELIIENNKSVKQINQDISNYDKSVQIPDCPGAQEINVFKQKVKRLMKNNMNLKIDLDNIKNYKNHWESVKGMLSFFLTECQLFAQIKDSLTDMTTDTEAAEILEKLEDIFDKEKSNFACNSVILNKEDFKGIEKLHKDQIDEKKRVACADPRSAREELISCLISRLKLLKQTLLVPPPTPLSQLVRRFDQDVKFRMTIEMAVADIANVLTACNIKLMKKSSMLLRDIDLGNVLDHGNPFLEVIGGIFNSHDLAAEWLDKAMMFVEDAESIEALYELFKGKMEYQNILDGDLLKMDDLQKELYAKLISSEKFEWKSYALLSRYYLIPKSQRPNT